MLAVELQLELELVLAAGLRLELGLLWVRALETEFRLVDLLE